MSRVRTLSVASMSRSMGDRLVLPARRVGPVTVGALVVALTVLWSMVALGWLLELVAWTVGRRRGHPADVDRPGADLDLAVGRVLVRWDRPHRDLAPRLAITGMVLLIPHVVLAANRQKTSWGSALANIAVYGLLALVVWAILPRWRSVLPRPARRVVAGVEAWAAGNRVAGGVLAGRGGCWATMSAGVRCTG